MDALALVDTFGCFSPEGAAYTVRRLKERFSQPIEVHFHDDFGMGTASTMAGLAAGASVAHVTVNGLGERCGSVALEQVALGLKALYGQDCGIKLDKLKELSEFVAKTANFPVPPTKPVVGGEIFGWETGMPSSMWLNCKDTEPLAMLPYMWNVVGQREPVISVGKKSGKDNIKLWLKQGNFNLHEEKEGELLGRVKEKSNAPKLVLTREEFAALGAQPLAL